MWSQIEKKKKIAYVSTKLLLEKRRKKMKTFTIFGRFWGQKQFFWQISETIFSKQFPLVHFFVSTLDSKMSRNIYPMKVRILQTMFFKVTLRTIQAIFPQVCDHITKTVFSKKFLLLFTLNSRMFRNICIRRQKL